MNIPYTNLPRLVIIGGGFAGVALARKMVKENVQLVLLDRHNYHTFQPLLYQVSNLIIRTRFYCLSITKNRKKR